ncbi:MAG TPA: histidine kinase [Puia sp.]|nr:histidine kinase [Puia sp.]
MTEGHNTGISAPPGVLPFLIDPRFRIYRHLLALTAIAGSLYSNPGIGRNLDITYAQPVLFLTLLIIFYTNMYWLVPRYLFRNKYPQYALGLAFYIGLTWLSGDILFRVNHVTPEGNGVFFLFFIVLIQVAASTAIKLFQRWAMDTQRIAELEKATMQSELEQLKNQINPHFLLNMLNNANVLTQKNPEKASQVLMKLSGFLQYQLYDSTRAKVLLTAEIQFVTDLLSLEKVRREDFQFTVSQEGNISGIQLSPLIFVVFVENAVKHSLDSENASFITLHFAAQKDEIRFTCTNSRPRSAVERKDRGGLGLANVRRRLELLYPGRHDLIIDNAAGTYEVTLTIRIP